MTKQDALTQSLHAVLSEALLSVTEAYGEVTLVCSVETMMTVFEQLKDHHSFAFDQLIDVCAVDYLQHGQSDWETDCATDHGFSRAASLEMVVNTAWDNPRFAVVYHLLSTTHNHRLRVRVFLEDETSLTLPSVYAIWQSANWFEREAYDLYGIIFEGHPDLRRILTDYGFIGHPFRKDFPISGHVEMRYDATQKKVIYEPIVLQPRSFVPKVIRQDNRYLDPKGVVP
jgi:NADH-quinone oxidoreductase subunit C